ncbi:MAG: phosphoribosylanthranilate isomerase [Sedimenticolaceae bacterium]|jgi:phosphoribosylanthranilate isomerase
MRTRIKICGITSVEDALAATRLGADAIGLVFYPPSPRYVEVEQAAEIAAALPPFVTTVALFVNADEQTIADVVSRVRIDLIQFHGNECKDYCGMHQRPYIKAVRMSDDVDLDKQLNDFSQARGLLLDTYKAGVPGGTGEQFNWDRVPAHVADKIILAGGLTPENVKDAVVQVHPYAVDVSGGVESAPGKKDTEKMARFIEAVRSQESRS